jgi:signal transduction histidine kinase
MDRVRGYQMGAVDFVFAPVVPEILRAKVSVFVELFRKRVQLGHANERLRAEIIERKKAQEQALHAERLATIGRMVAALAHESRNALQQIQAAIEMLERRIKSEPEKSLLAEIQKAQDRVLRLLEEVRGYAAPIELSLEIHNLGDLWHNAWTELTALRGQRDVSLQVHADGVDLRCRVDPKPAGRLFRHVLEHALTACPSPGRIDVRFRAVEHKGAPALCARVEDNGPGLSEEQRQHIFEPFPPTKKPGPGLGMAIAKRIVDAHGGQIAIANGTGTAIEVLLPKGSI